MAWTETARAKVKRPSSRFESDLTDAEWAQLLPLLPGPARTGRPWQVALREVVNALLYRLTTGCQWRVLPTGFPSLRRFGTTSTGGATRVCMQTSW